MTARSADSHQTQSTIRTSEPARETCCHYCHCQEQTLNLNPTNSQKLCQITTVTSSIKLYCNDGTCDHSCVWKRTPDLLHFLLLIQSQKVVSFQYAAFECPIKSSIEKFWYLIISVLNQLFFTCFNHEYQNIQNSMQYINYYQK